jgi:hypothetical protein
MQYFVSTPMTHCRTELAAAYLSLLMGQDDRPFTPEDTERIFTKYIEKRTKPAGASDRG